MYRNMKPDPGVSNAVWQTGLSYWRIFRAEEYSRAKIESVAACVAQISSTVPEWSLALKGDAAAIIGIVLPCKPPKLIGIKVDLTMTTLLNVAFENAEAARVMSDKLKEMPLDPLHRSRLATSWLVHNIYLGSRDRLRP